MKIAISTESTSDMTKEMLEKYDVHILPYEILLGDKTFYDGELTTQEMFDYVDKTGTLPKLRPSTNSAIRNISRN